MWSMNKLSQLLNMFYFILVSLFTRKVIIKLSVLYFIYRIILSIIFFPFFLQKMKRGCFNFKNLQALWWIVYVCLLHHLWLLRTGCSPHILPHCKIENVSLLLLYTNIFVVVLLIWSFQEFHYFHAR